MTCLLLVFKKKVLKEILFICEFYSDDFCGTCKKVHFDHTNHTFAVHQLQGITKILKLVDIVVLSGLMFSECLNAANISCSPNTTFFFFFSLFEFSK